MFQFSMIFFFYTQKPLGVPVSKRIEVYKQFVFGNFPPRKVHTKVCPAGSRSEKVVTSPPSAHAMVSQEKNQRHVDNIKKVGQDKENVSNRSPACPKVLSMSMGVDPSAPRSPLLHHV
jgi:hypothetical protein